MATSQGGIDIYKGRFAGEAYYAAKGDTLIILRGTMNDTEKIAALYDSLEKIDDHELVKLIGVAVMPKVPPPEPKTLDISDAPFAVYIPEYTVERFELMSSYLNDKSEYEGSNPRVRFFYGANWNMADEAKYSVEQESVKSEFKPIDECGRAKYEFKESYNLIGPCEVVGQTNNGEDVYFAKDWQSSYYVINKNGTNVKIWSFGSSRLGTNEALMIFNSLRPATNDELAEMRPRD